MPTNELIATPNPLNGRRTIIAVALAVLTFALYWQVRTFSFLMFDDPLYVAQNPVVLRGLTVDGLEYAMTARVSGNWHPATLLTEMAAVQFFGGSAKTMHLLCAGLHSANVALLFLFLVAATDRIWPAAVVAAVWGWHPLRVESVAWVGELKDVLCGFFWLGTMLAYLAYRRRGRWWRYGLVVMCAALAMSSKPMAVTLPAVLLLLNVWPIRDANYRSRFGLVVEIMPLLALAVAVAVVTLRTQEQDQFVATTDAIPIGLRCTNALRSTLMYVVGQAAPVGMGLLYPHPGTLGRTVPVWQWSLGLLVMICVSVLLWRGRRSAPFAAAGWLWFLGTLVPVIGLVQVGLAARADRYTYLPSIGLIWAAVWAINALTRSIRAKGAVALAVVITCAAGTYVQTGYWRTNQTLLLHSAAVIRDDFVAFTGLAMDESSGVSPAARLKYADAAVAIAPHLSEPHRARGNALRDLDRPAEALAEYQTALRLAPSSVDVMLNLGDLLLRAGKVETAGGLFSEVIRREPRNVVAYNGMARTLFRRGDLAGAANACRAGIAVDPGWDQLHGVLGDVLRGQGDHSGAIAAYSAALSAGANNPDWIAALTYEVAIDPAFTAEQIAPLLPAAEDACRRTGDREPFQPYAYSLALARLGRWDQAIAAAESAARAAEATKQKPQADVIRKRIESYRRHRMVG